MPITFRAATTQGQDTTANLTVTRPTAAVGDLLVAFVTLSHDDSSASVTSSGWTVRLAPTVADAGPRFAVLSRSVVSSEAASYVFTKSSGVNSQLIVHAVTFSGADLDAPLAVAPVRQLGSTSSTITAPSVTAIADSLLVCVFGAEQYVATANSRSFSTPSGMTELSDFGHVFNYHAVDIEQRDAGATGTRAATFQTRSSGAAASPAASGAISLVLRSAITAVAPTVNAGADTTGRTGDPFTRTATENDGGATITTRAWTVLTGPAQVGQTIGTAAALTWTPTVAGTYTLRYQATNSAGTGTDDVTVAVAPRAILVDGARAATAAGRPQTGHHTTLAARPARAATHSGAPQIGQQHSITARSGRAATHAGQAGTAQTHTVVVYGPRSSGTATRAHLEQHSALDVTPAAATPRAGQPTVGNTTPIAVYGARAATTATTPELVTAGIKNARAETTATAPTVTQHHQVDVAAAAVAAPTVDRVDVAQRVTLDTTAAAAATTADAVAVTHTSGIAVGDAAAAPVAGQATTGQRTPVTISGSRTATAAGLPLIAGEGDVVVYMTRAVPHIDAPLLQAPIIIAVPGARSDAAGTRVDVTGHAPLHTVTDVAAATTVTRAQLTTKQALVLAHGRAHSAVDGPLTAQNTVLSAWASRALTEVTLPSLVPPPATEARNPTGVMVLPEFGLVRVELVSMPHTVRININSRVHVLEARGTVLETF